MALGSSTTMPATIIRSRVPISTGQVPLLVWLESSPNLTSVDQGNMTAEFLTTSWTWTPNSTWVNDLRGGWNRFDRLVNVADYQTPVTSFGINTGLTASNLQGLPTIYVSGLSGLGGDSKTPK